LPPPPVVSQPAPVPAPAAAPAEAVQPTLVTRPTVEEHVPSPPAASSPEPLAAAHREPARVPRETTTRDLAPRLGLQPPGAEASSRRGLWVGLTLGAAVLLAAGAWFYFGRSWAVATTTTTTMSPEVVAAMARVKELEGRIAQMESERAAAETKAADEARTKLEAQAAAKGRSVDPAALQRAQEDARQRARAEQDRKQQEELARIVEARRAEEKRIAEASPSPPLPTPEPTAAAPATPTPEATTVATAPPITTAAAPEPAPVAPVATAEPTTPGMTVEANDPRLVRPVLVSKATARYPLAAEAMGAAGVVEVLALIDERGNVVEASVVRVKPAKLGFEEAAVQHVRSMKYRPGTRDGLAVKVRLPIVVNFKPRPR
jgi:TonB family protein